MKNQINIDFTKQAPFFGYKMPKMDIYKTNSTTNLNNLHEVAQALRVPDFVLLKFIATEVAASTVGRSGIRGIHSVYKIRKLLNKFIQKYVLCGQCVLPEVHYVIEKKKLISACDGCKMKSKLDQTHKASILLIKHLGFDVYS